MVAMLLHRPQLSRRRDVVKHALLTSNAPNNALVQRIYIVISAQHTAAAAYSPRRSSCRSWSWCGSAQCRRCIALQRCWLLCHRTMRPARAQLAWQWPRCACQRDTCCSPTCGMRDTCAARVGHIWSSCRTHEFDHIHAVARPAAMTCKLMLLTKICTNMCRCKPGAEGISYMGQQLGGKGSWRL